MVNKWKFWYFDIINNTGNINCSLAISSNKDAAAFIGGTDPAYYLRVTDKETGSCSGGEFGNWVVANGTAVTYCDHFSSVTATDEIYVDAKLTIPHDANPGATAVHKQSILTITASATA